MADKKDNQEIHALYIEDIEMMIFESLMLLGYVPSEDEIQDLADVFLDLLDQIMEQMGIETLDILGEE